MSDHEGKLTEEEKQKILAWLESHEKQPRVCQLCGSTNWLLAEHVVQPLRYGPQIYGGVAYPQIMLISQPCGHTLYVNAVMIGLYPPSATQESPT